MILVIRKPEDYSILTGYWTCGYWARKRLGSGWFIIYSLLRSYVQWAWELSAKCPRSWRWRSRLLLREEPRFTFKGTSPQCLLWVPQVASAPASSGCSPIERRSLWLWYGTGTHWWALNGGHFQSSIPLNLSSTSSTYFYSGVEFARCPLKIFDRPSTGIHCHTYSWSKIWDLYLHWHGCSKLAGLHNHPPHSQAMTWLVQKGRGCLVALNFRSTKRGGFLFMWLSLYPAQTQS